MVLPPVDAGLEMTAERLVTNAGVMLASVLLFAGCFLGSAHRLMPRLCRNYALMAPTLQAEFASRVHSTLHAVIVPSGLLWAIEACSLWGEPLVNTCRPAEVFFSISVGYFVVDLVIIVVCRTEFWQLFLFHHTIALLPYAINNFVPTCSHAHFLLSLMLGVELSTIFLNLKWWLEQMDDTGGSLYSFAFYGMYVSWFVVRVVNPIYVVILMINYVFPYYSLDPRVLISYAAGFLVTAFCWYCFFFIFTPEACQRLRRLRAPKPAPLDLGADAPADHRLLVGEEDSATDKSTPRLSRTRSRSSNLVFA